MLQADRGRFRRLALCALLALFPAAPSLAQPGPEAIIVTPPPEADAVDGEAAEAPPREIKVRKRGPAVVARKQQRGKAGKARGRPGYMHCNFHGCSAQYDAAMRQCQRTQEQCLRDSADGGDRCEPGYACRLQAARCFEDTAEKYQSCLKRLGDGESRK